MRTAESAIRGAMPFSARALPKASRMAARESISVPSRSKMIAWNMV
jgi:hypothetical protein